MTKSKPIVALFVIILTNILALLHVTVGWPGTWLLVFTPLIVWWVLFNCFIIVAFIFFILAVMFN